MTINIKYCTTGEFTKMVREMSSQLFVIPNKLSIYPSAHKQLRRHLPNPLREFPCILRINWDPASQGRILESSKVPRNPHSSKGGSRNTLGFGTTLNPLGFGTFWHPLKFLYEIIIFFPNVYTIYNAYQNDSAKFQTTKKKSFLRRNEN